MKIEERKSTKFGRPNLLRGAFDRWPVQFFGKLFTSRLSGSLRGTGESFAANIGGRMLGISRAGVTAIMAGQSFTSGESAPAKFAVVADCVALTLFAVNLEAILPKLSTANVEE